MGQIIINTGNVANDGLGTPLRNAFDQVNYNFTQLFNAGPSGSNIVIANNSITVTNTNGNLRLATNGIGSIVPAANFVPDVPNIRSIGAGTNRFNTVYAQYINANTGTFAGNVYVAGNLQVTGNVITVNYSNLSVANSNITLATGAANAAQADGGGMLIPIAGANFTYDYSANSWNSTIAITAPTFIGDGANLTNVIANVQANALLGNTFSNSINYSNLTSFGQISALSITGNVSTTGNVYANAVVGNRITANYLYGNGSNITNITANAIVGNVPFALVANTAYVANLAALATQAINADTALFAINANLASFANTATIAQTANAATYAVQADNANSAVVAGMAYQLASTANLSITGNITTGGYFIGDGGLISNILVTTTYANSNVAAYLPTDNTIISIQSNISNNSSNITTLQGQVYANSNVSSYLQALTSNISTTGNITATYFFGNGSQLTGIAANYGNANVVANLAALGSNPISTTGNITANYFVGNGSQLTGLPAGYSNDNVFTYLANSNVVISTTGNISGSYIFGNGSQLTGISGGNANTGNVTFDNINVIGTGNLHLQPDPTNAASYLDIFLTSGPDLHVTNNDGSLILGEDAGANVMVGVSPIGNVSIQSWNGYTSTGNTWTFGTDGTTTFPTLTVDLHNGGNQSAQTLQFGGPGQQAIITGPTPAENYSAERLIIQGQRGNGTGEGGDVYVWAGDADTNGGDIKIYAGDADNVSTGTGGYINLAGGDGFDSGGGITIIGGVSANAQGGQVSMVGGSGELDGGSASLQGGYGANGQGGAVQIAGGGGNSQAAFGNVEIGSGTYSWLFDNTGNVRLPGNTFAVNYANGTQVSIGGGGGSELVNGVNSFVLDGDGNVVFEGDGVGQGVNRGLVWDYGANANGVNSQVRQGNDGLSVRAYTEDSGNYAASVNIITNQDANTKFWEFDGYGNLTLPGNLIVPEGNIVSYALTPAFSSSITGITTGNATVIVALTDSMFGDPFSGTVTISGVTGTTEANDVWGYDVVEVNAFQLYTDATLTTPVDGTTWTAYVSGGTAVGVGIYSNLTVQGGNVFIGSNDKIWTFGTTGNVTIPGNIVSTSTINIDNRAAGNGADIQLFAADDIVLQARDRSAGSGIEGGDINIYAGDSAEDGDTSGGDVVIEAGAGGAGNIDFGGTGGFIRIEAGRGGAAIGNTGATAESGGDITIYAGDAGNNNGNIDLGANGGDVFIESGFSTGNTNSGGDIVLTTGTGGQNGASGNVQITIPGYGLTTGGTWKFDANGNLTLAGGNSVIQSIANSSLDPNISNVSTMVFTPDQNYTSQSLVIDPTGPSHIHLRSPGANIDEPYANIFLGGETSSFEVGYYNGSTPNVFIHSGGNTWTFDTTGNLTFPRDASNISTDPILSIVSGATPIIRSDDASLAGPANLAISADYLNLSGFTGNKIVAYPDQGVLAADVNLVLFADFANVGNTNSSWTFGIAGNLTLPTIELDVGNTVNEQTVIQSQRKIIPPFRYSVEITGSTPTTVYTATGVSITSMKVAMQIQHIGLGFEFFDVSATYTGGNTYYTVSNRLQPPTIADSTVVVDLNGSNTMDITVTVNSGAANSWVTYDSTEFGIAVD